jgi:hypothetical protein
MKLGGHLIFNFYRQFKKEFKVESNNFALENKSSGKTSMDMRSEWV